MTQIEKFKNLYEEEEEERDNYVNKGSHSPCVIEFIIHFVFRICSVLYCLNIRFYQLCFVTLVH